MNVISKYQLEMWVDSQTITVPSNAKILHVSEDVGKLSLWLMFDEIGADYFEDRTFFIIPPEQHFNENGMYFVQTVITKDGFVFNVFEFSK